MSNKQTLSAPIPASVLAVQMYTVRDQTKTQTDFAASLAQIAQTGYRAVQLSAIGAMDAGDVSPATARRMLDDNALRCIATHRPWNELAERTDDAIALHQTLGCDYVAIGMLPQNYRAEGADGYRRFVSDALPVIARLKAAGIRFGYHNHALEFARAAPGLQTTLYDIFAAEGGADFHLEVDLYWAWDAGAGQ